MKAMEISELKLQGGADLRCESQACGVPLCQACESCVLAGKLAVTKEWFIRAGDNSQRRFLFGVIRRLKSLDLLAYVERVLQPALGKDFTYSRSRINPSLAQDLSTASSDRALNRHLLLQFMVETWDWFKNGSYWTKANYALLLLQMCSPHLLHGAANLIHVLIARHRQQRETQKEAVEDDGGRVQLEVPDHQTEDDPTLMVVPTSFQSTSGVTKYRDFIRCLPVHLSKKILGYLKKKQLFGCLLVSHHWCYLTKELLLDLEAERLVRNEAMILQEWSSSEFLLELFGTMSQEEVRTFPPEDLILQVQQLPALWEKGHQDHSNVRLCERLWEQIAKSYVEGFDDLPRKEKPAHGSLLNKSLSSQGTSYKGVSVSYAKRQPIPVPKIGEDGNTLPRLEKYYKDVKAGESLEVAYAETETEMVIMEERNLFCGSYNVLILTGQGDPHRVIHFDGGRLVAAGSTDRKVKLYDMVEMAQAPPLIQGHSGSIRVVRLCEDRGFVFSGGFDLSIRQWDIHTGVCLHIFHGHMKTITCLDVQEDLLLSGAKDGHVKVWNVETGKCLRTFKHKEAVLAVKMRENMAVSGCEKGVVKVWHIEAAELIKTLTGHQGAIKCLSFDQWHLVSGAADGYAIAWSMMGKFQKRLMTFRHPKEVMCLELLFLRVITGCADGKIRVFNLLNGDCLRVMRANSRGDPVAALCIQDNRMVINVLSSIMIFQFEDVSWDYSQTSERVDVLKERERFHSSPLKVRPYSYVRAQRMKRVGSSNRKIYQTGEGEGLEARSQLTHHARSLSARSTKRAHDLHVESLKPSTWPELVKYRRSYAYIDLQPEFIRKPPSACRPHTAAHSSAEAYSRASTAPDVKANEDSDGESGYGSPGRKSAVSISESATLRRMKGRGPHTPMSPDHILLKVSTLQNLQRVDEIGLNLEYNSRIRDVWRPPLSRSQEEKAGQASRSKEAEKVDVLAILEYLKSSTAPAEMKNIITAFEMRKLSLKLKESLHGPEIQSTIPAPAVVRPQTSCGYRKKERRPTLSRRSTSAVEIGVKRIGLYTSPESVQPIRMVMGQNHQKVISKRAATAPVASVDPYREKSGFQLLTVKQLKEFQQEKMFQHREAEALTQATKTKESRKAWLRKIKGENIDGFTKEGKIAAPEFGPNVYL